MTIVSANHEIYDFSRHVPSRPIVTDDNIWIGSQAVILPGVHPQSILIVAAGAVVLNDSLPNCLLVEVPAKVVKTLPEYGSGK